ncbi:class I SAM-dependent methyltransferase [Brenneria goodwinii]|uniref:class I SAM-dependent methyltransferase n=1 Tax=Brenneria goodwinii TaxID=1109412 RepID=UPI000EF27E3B|nr:class I SAM-dependent methyltransferase [Brenneria goodwinii]MCG8157006.1 class I SAM-dependent methyltransferase [Brenneria goodwinii]MCG8161357.1 class I SAM-dependent methyltransferase [Brenneria goodwinii]MCG8167112.1 class I SAM-dependent methyltransferase [Brenneria goodwinii]MCG8171693.1 class I SAM-dependent methyltransferase [Brenneria goodwinii]MCG8175528.1 class I SAM-dependent methyltransferase [Brenneria goodwinii]
MSQLLVENESRELLDDVQCYWTSRAASYSKLNAAELANAKRDAWLQKINEYAPRKPVLKVLDIGSGPGFFAVMMALAGHQVTAVDITQAMLDQARANAARYGAEVNFVSSDVHTLPFADARFDLIVTRNVTWNLDDPQRAYEEWHRVLAPGGRLINFDANWYLQLFDEQSRLGYLADRANARYLGLDDHYVNTDTAAMENIARQLPLSRERRPQWDTQALLRCGYRKIMLDTRVGDELWDETEKVNYASTPMFLICAEK